MNNSNLKKILNEVEDSQKYKSSYWIKMTKGISLNENLFEWSNNGAFGNISEATILKRFYHYFFQRLLFLKDKKIFKSKNYYAMRHICSLVNRNLNLDCLRHVYTHNILDPIYRESKRICSIGDGRCNFISIIIYCYKNIDKIVHVNLPEVLYADYILIKQLGIIKDNEIIFISCEEEMNKALENNTIKLILLTPNFSQYLKNKNIDLFVNIASFQEMNYSMIDNYFEIIKSNQAFFYCCNRESKSLDSNRIIKYSNFPFGNTNTIFYNYCPWHQDYYDYFPPFIKKYDGAHIHSLVKYGKIDNKIYSYYLSKDKKKYSFFKNFKNLIFYILKVFVKKIIQINIIRKLFNSLLILSSDNLKTINHNKKSLKFINTNSITNYRIETFSSKEPETLNWIDSFEENSVFWDIGANIGLYSIYASKTKNIKTISFEPGIFNIELLSKNIFVNKLQNNIKIFPLPLSNVTEFNIHSFSNIMHGGALNSFGSNLSQDGERINSIFEVQSFGITPNDVVEKLSFATPDYIKIDVDGNEHLILEKADKILETAKSVVVEINEHFIDQKNKSFNILTEKGFKLKNKYFFSDTEAQFNYHWFKN